MHEVGIGRATWLAADVGDGRAHYEELIQHAPHVCVLCALLLLRL